MFRDSRSMFVLCYAEMNYTGLTQPSSGSFLCIGCHCTLYSYYITRVWISLAQQSSRWWRHASAATQTARSERRAGAAFNTSAPHNAARWLLRFDPHLLGAQARRCDWCISIPLFKGSMRRQEARRRPRGLTPALGVAPIFKDVDASACVYAWRYGFTPLRAAFTNYPSPRRSWATGGRRPRALTPALGVAPFL
jgi:hypothetical protein